MVYSVRLKKRSELGVKFSKNKISALLFADDFVGLVETESALQILIDIVHNYSKCWQFEANVKKCAIVVFVKNGVGLHHPRPTSKVGGFGVMKAFPF